ncbi:MAG: transglutaminase [Cereibacter sphaeroides]|uniref:Transglutaminase n=1 Tax=Cereibacter sphaeroides TaxID=1063 RepID=A0A2W5SDZ3_CERSP|nr:MAG: transglutaminase [Cereibacter sphaeroides]
MLIRFGYEITVSCPQETPMIAMMTPREEFREDIQTTTGLVIQPSVRATAYHDQFGNICHRFTAPAGLITLSSDSLIWSDGVPEPAFPDAGEVPVTDLPSEVLTYLLGSRYCETDKLSQIAWDLFGHLPPGWGRVQAICDWVNGHIRFDYQMARATRTAFEAWQEQTGVCRDFAHLAITFCRCLNIPARYANAYLGDIGVPPVDAPMDFAASIEVYLEGGWHSFDPRNNQRRIGRIVVAHGHDAGDVPLIHSFGQHVLQSFRVWTDEAPEVAEPTRLSALAGRA